MIHYHFSFLEPALIIVQYPEADFLLAAFTTIDAATFEVIAANLSRDITKNQFQRQLMISILKQTSLHHTYKKEEAY